MIWVYLAGFFASQLHQRSLLLVRKIAFIARLNFAAACVELDKMRAVLAHCLLPVFQTLHMLCRRRGGMSGESVLQASTRY